MVTTLSEARRIKLRDEADKAKKDFDLAYNLVIDALTYKQYQKLTGLLVDDRQYTTLLRNVRIVSKNKDLIDRANSAIQLCWTWIDRHGAYLSHIQGENI